MDRFLCGTRSSDLLYRENGVAKRKKKTDGSIARIDVKPNGAVQMAFLFALFEHPTYRNT